MDEIQNKLRLFNEMGNGKTECDRAGRTKNGADNEEAAVYEEKR